MITWSHAYYVDNDKEEITPVDVDGTDYRRYLQFYTESLLGCSKLSAYQAISSTAEAVSLILSSANATYNGKDCSAKAISHCESINDRFLRYEIEAKENVARMNTLVRSGCLIHALLKNESSIYYLIAKVDWTAYLEEGTMKINQGIEVDNRRLGKSCLFRLTENEDNTFKVDEISVLLEHSAVYFTKDFLEIAPVYEDGISTKNMTKRTLGLIDDQLKKSYPNDRLLLRNAFLVYMRGHEFVDYEEMKNTIFDSYLDSEICDIDNRVKDNLRCKLDTLPESGHLNGRFSRQFSCIPSEIKGKMVKSRYRLTSFAELEIIDTLESNERFGNVITSGTEDTGKSYIKIYTNDSETLRAFNFSRNP